MWAYWRYWWHVCVRGTNETFVKHLIMRLSEASYAIFELRLLFLRRRPFFFVFFTVGWYVAVFPYFAVL